MRTRILTPRERQHIQKWLKGEKIKGKFHEMLKYRCKKYMPKLSEEIELIQNFLDSN